MSLPRLHPGPDTADRPRMVPAPYLVYSAAGDLARGRLLRETVADEATCDPNPNHTDILAGGCR